jgi:hypothetical protein
MSEKQEDGVTLEDILLKVLESGVEGNPKEITLRLVDRVRQTLNRLADDGKIKKYGEDGQGIEKRYGLHDRPFSPPRFKLKA